MRADVIVLGAGMVGVGAALALQARGRDVAIIERRGEAGRETSYGNAGLIERASVDLYTFPRDIGTIARTVLGLNAAARIDWAALPQTLPWIARYFFESAPARAALHARYALPLIERCLSEHMELASAANATALIRKSGWIKAFRSERTLAAGAREARHIRDFGLTFDALDARALAALEPNVSGFAGAIVYRDPASCVDPGGLVAAYAALFARRGGRMFAGDARSLEQTPQGWSVATSAGAILAREAVVALGPWSDEIFRPLGYEIPLGVKRGYHMHYATTGNAVLGHPLLDADGGFLLAPMARGVRLTTGAEFARRDDPPSPVQLDRVEPLARKTFPLGARLDDEAWMGSRPCLPDLLPVIGPAPRHAGLWFDFGHQHHGFTLGPITGRLLAEMMTGEAPFADPAPYAADRF
ncbi:MAG: FAD-binding oxidoreductase [Hyphomicrobiales bacterium]|nr:FAD-binding oxidoreductase [Hyphomicrobiales bacterium]